MPVPAPHAEALARIPVRERELAVLGSTTRIWEYGPEDAADTVVFVHGYRGDHHGLEPVVAELPGIRIISPDLPGFGASTPMTDAPHSVEGYARWLATFVAALELPEPPVVLGHSFGSMVSSAALAAGLPARALVLVNPITTLPTTATGPVMMALTRFFYGVSRIMPERMARGWLGSRTIVRFMTMALATTTDRTLKRWILEEHLRYFSGFSDARTVLEGFRASISTQVGAFAPRIAVPTLLVAGDADTIAPASGQHRAVGEFPDGRLVMIPGVGHLAHYETPGAVAEALQGFLAEQRNGTPGAAA